MKWTIEGKDRNNNIYFQCLVDESRKANAIKLLTFSIEVEEDYNNILILMKNVFFYLIKTPIQLLL